MIDAIIFDVAGVIVIWDKMLVVDPGEDEFAEFMESDLWETVNDDTDRGLSAADAQDRVWQVDPRLGELFATYLDRFERTVPGPVPGTAELIGELQAAGYPVYGLSNWAAWDFHVARDAAPVIDELTDLIVSGEVGLIKPEPEIFELAVERFGVRPESTVFIDDREENLEAAAALGFQTILFTTAAEARAALVAAGARL